jgi:DNA-3-methyladenine glycosylase I
MEEKNLTRCGWGEKYPNLTEYHDREWGVPLFDEERVFELFSLDVFQAGLSWLTILNKREAFRKAFNNFQISRIADYDALKIEELLNDKGIVRNKLKIPAVIHNAQLALELRKEFGSFSKYIWSFSNHKTIVNQWQVLTDIPVTSAVSDAMSKDMIRRGFKFAGSTICYAFMQSIGMVNDHLVTCFRHHEVSEQKDLFRP